LFPSNFSRLAEKISRKQRDRSEMIRGSTNINWVCEKRVSCRIDAVYDNIPSLELDSQNVRTSFLYNCEPSYVVSTKMKKF